MPQIHLLLCSCQNNVWKFFPARKRSACYFSLICFPIITDKKSYLLVQEKGKIRFITKRKILGNLFFVLLCYWHKAALLWPKINCKWGYKTCIMESTSKCNLCYFVAYFSSMVTKKYPLTPNLSRVVWYFLLKSLIKHYSSIILHF